MAICLRVLDRSIRLQMTASSRFHPRQLGMGNGLVANEWLEEHMVRGHHQI